jgi:hypothetical protein
MAIVSIPLLAFNVLAALLLWSILLAVGARLRRLFRFPTSPSLRWSVDLTLGAWAAAAVLLVAGLFGLVNRIGLAVLVVLMAAAGRWCHHRRPVGPLIAGVLGGMLFLPVALGPPFFYDAMVYHLGLPWQALLDGGWRAHPEDLFAAFPPLAQLLALPPLAADLVRAPAMLHWLAWVTAATGVYGLARRFGGRRVGAWIAACFCLVPPVAPLVPGFPAAEAWLLVGLIPAIAVASGPCRPGSAALAGLLAGAATAARLQGLPWTALVLLLIVFRCRSGVRPIILAVGCWVAGSLPWWCKNLVLLGDPIAPVLWRRAGIETLWRDSQSMLRRGDSLADILASMPRLLGPELVWLLPLSLAAVLAIVGRRRTVMLAAAVVFGFAAWAATGALPRFLAPTGCLLLALVATAGRDRIVRFAAGAAILWCGIVGFARGAEWLHRISARELVRLDFREAGARVSPNDPMAAFAAAGALPADARVLFVAEPRLFSFPRPVTAPSQHDASPLQELIETASSPSQIEGRLRSDGYTHLLVNWGELRRLGGSYPVAPWRTSRGRQLWSELIEELGPPVIDHPPVQIFRLCSKQHDQPSITSTDSVKLMPSRQSSSSTGS